VDTEQYFRRLFNFCKIASESRNFDWNILWNPSILQVDSQ